MLLNAQQNSSNMTWMAPVSTLAQSTLLGQGIWSLALTSFPTYLSKCQEKVKSAHLQLTESFEDRKQI